MYASYIEIVDTGSGTGNAEWGEQRVVAPRHKLAILEKHMELAHTSSTCWK